MKEMLGDMLESVGSHFWKFVKRLYVLTFFFGLPYGISCGVALLAPICFHSIGLPHDISMVISRILLTIVPIIPTALYTRFKKEDSAEEFSMDLCFVIWIATAVYAWKFL